MLKNYLPIFVWLPNYRKSYLAGDISAGLTVGIMLIPQGMAYAMIAGLPPIYGLYAALVPNLLYAFTGSSRKLAVGPVALDSLIVASGLATMKLSNEGEYIAMAFFLAFFVGLLQLLMGVFKMGFLANFLSRPVVSGFTSAAALVIAVGQLKYILGIKIEVTKTLDALRALAAKLSEIIYWDLAIGILAIFVIVLLKRVSKKLPSTMLVVILSIIGINLFMKQEGDVTLLGIIPEGLPIFTMHDMGQEKWGQAFPLCLALAFISFAEAMSMAKTVEEKSQEFHTNPNQELRALGISNIVGSLFQSFPANAGFSRTAVNVSEGAKTGLASIISAGVVALALVFLTSYFEYLPKSVLGAIILVAIYGLIDLNYPAKLFRQQKDEFIVLLVTFLTTLLIGITQGIVFGVLFSLLLLVYRTSRPHIAVLGKIKGMEYFKNLNRFPEDTEEHDEILMLRFDAQLFFANIQYFKKVLLQEISKKGDKLEYIILNAEPVNYIDNTALNQLQKIVESLNRQGITFKITGLIGPIRDIVQKSELVTIIGGGNIYVRTAEAYEDCLKKVGKSAMQEKVSLQHE